MTIQNFTSAARKYPMADIDGISPRFARLKMAPMILVAMVAAMAGCANRDNMATGSIDDDYRQRHPIVLTQAEHNVDIPVAPADRHLVNGMRDTIRGFTQDYKAHATGTVEILAPQGAENAMAVSSARRQIRQELVAGGIPPRRIVDSSYPARGAGDAAPIRLRFMATTATTNACGQWPEDLNDNAFDNKNYYNFGCSQQNNLAAQIANPTDLIAPRAETPIDAEQRGKIISDYRSGSLATSAASSGGLGQ
jgi:pilus assembly protein CpaD